MGELPPDPSGGDNTEKIQDGAPPSDGTDAGSDDPTPTAPAAETTPPFGTPPPGAPGPGGTPPFGTPPPGTPPPGSPPPGTPPWPAGGWAPGAPVWVGPAPWYGWGPPWPGGPPPQATSGSAPPASRKTPLPWVIIGCVLAAFAMVAIGLGIGYGVWGANTPAAARNGVSAPAPGFFAPGFAPVTGPGGFLGVEVETARFTTTGTTTGGSTGTTSSSAPATPGARVEDVVPSSPAAKAGIVKGDVITEIGTRSVTSVETLELDVLRTAPGQRVKLGWVTSTGKHESATVTLAKRPTARSAG